MGRVVKNTKNGTVHFDTELDPNELAVIGRVTVLWGRLEHLMMLATVENFRSAETEVSLATNDAFSVRLRAFYDVVKAVVNQKERERLLRIHAKISNLQVQRHQLTHGFWDWAKDDPNSLRVVGTRPKREFEASWDIERLYEFGSRIGEVLFDLEFPGGWRELSERRSAAGGAISRDGLRLFSGTLPSAHPLSKSLSSEDSGKEQ